MAQKSLNKAKTSTLKTKSSRIVVGKGTSRTAARAGQASWRNRPLMGAVFILAIGAIGSLLVWAIFADQPTDVIDHKEVAQAYNTQLLADVSDFKKSPQNAQALGKLKQTAKERKLAMQDLLHDDAASFLQLSKSDGFASDVPAEVTADTEHAVTASGRLEATISESVDGLNGKAVDEHSVKTTYALIDTAGTRHNLYLDREVEPKLLHQNVSVGAIQLGDEYAAATASVAAAAPGVNGATLAAQVRSVAIIMVNFKSDTSKPYSSSQVSSALLGSAGAFNSYYSQVTNNRIGFTGKVFGYYTLNFSNTTSTCDWQNWGAAAYAAAGGDAALSSYNHVMYVFPYQQPCTWGGQGDVGGKFTWINGNFTSPYITVHELGHNLGMSHARTLSCTDSTGSVVSINDNCSAYEYGDPNDVMGYNNPPMGVAAFRRAYLGVIPASNIVTATSGTYTIAPVQDITSTPQLLKIPRTIDSAGNPSDYYYVDFRRAQSTGYDAYASGSNPVSGVQIRRGPDQSIGGARTDLIDTTPTSGGGFGDAALTAGLDFVDSGRNIRISTQSVSADSATVTVNGPASTVCVRQEPTLRLDTYSIYGSPGQSVQTTLSVTSNDTKSCIAATYSLAAGLYGGFTQTPSTASFSIAPGETKLIPITITAPSAISTSYTAIDENVTTPVGTFKATFGFNTTLVTNTGPVVRIVTPSDTTNVTATTTLTASASSMTRIRSFQLYIDGVRKASAKGTSLSYSLDPAKLGTGSHRLQAIAKDSNGAVSAATITVTVP